MAVRRQVLGAVAVVAAGITAATLVGQLPAVGSADPGVLATPSSAGQRLVCPGPAIAIGAAGTAADSLTAVGAPTRVSGTVEGAKVTSKALKRGGVGGGGAAPRLLSTVAADAGAGAIAGAQMEQLTGNDVAGLVAAPCTAPVGEAWFAAGATTTGRTTVLALANASSVDSRVSIRVWTEDGPADTGVASDVVVPAGTRRALSLAGLVSAAGGLVVQVEATGAPVAAALEQRTVRGLESGGADLIGPGAAPATTQVIPGVRVAGAAGVAEARGEDDYGDLQTVVRVLVPGSAAADVRIVIAGDAGSQTVERRVAAGVVTDFPIDSLADGAYTVRVTATRPVVAGARVSVIGDAGASSTPDDAGSAPSSGGAAVGSDSGLVGGGAADEGADGGTATSASPASVARGIDLAWFASATPLGATAAVAVVDAPSPLVTVANPTRAARTVQVGTSSLQVPAGGSASIAAAPGLVVLRGVAGLTAAVSYTGATALAGYPVTAADQAARPVRITR